MANVREDAESPGLLAPGDVLIVVNGGRKSDASLLGCFGMTKDRKAADKGKKEKDGKTICRELIIALDEQSVIARKFRRKTRNDFLTCQQKAYIYYNATTGMKQRPHKYFSSTSNMSDVLGPFTLTCFKSMPKLTVKDKREFWGARRRAVGGRTDEGSGDDDEEAEDEESELEENEEETVGALALPATNPGRGTKGLADDVIQPVSYHALPTMVSESVLHAVWCISCIDLTPGAGDLAISAISQRQGYLGICQTDQQKDFIMTRLKKEVLRMMADAGSVHYMAAYAKLYAKDDAEGGDKLHKTTKKAKLEAPKNTKSKEEIEQSTPTPVQTQKKNPKETPKDKEADSAAPPAKKHKAKKEESGPPLSDALAKMLDAAKAANK